MATARREESISLSMNRDEAEVLVDILAYKVFGLGSRREDLDTIYDALSGVIKPDIDRAFDMRGSVEFPRND